MKVKNGVHNKKVIVLASGEGRLFQALVDQQEKHGYLVSALVVSNISCGAATRAVQNGIPVYQSAEVFSGRVELEADLVMLAGYLKLVPTAFIQHFEGRILNTHPSLLPRYGGKGMYGLRVHQAVIASGDTESGFTIHHVSERYDEGAVISQHVVAVLPGETAESLESKVKKLERARLPEFIGKFLSQI